MYAGERTANSSRLNNLCWLTVTVSTFLSYQEKAIDVYRQL